SSSGSPDRESRHLHQTRWAMKRYYVAGVILAGFAVVAVTGRQPPLRDGTMLDATTWEHAQNLLPEEILAHYQYGEYANKIADISLGTYVDIGFPPPFREASERNLGRFDVTERGTIVERDTGRQPSYIVGLPFPEIDPVDPAAGVKIVWN